MTCYFRHLNEIFQKAGVQLTRENRREIDALIRHIVGVKNESCPDTWREVKKRIKENEADFVSRLKDAWNKRK